MVKKRPKFIVLHENDNVGTALEDIIQDSEIELSQNRTIKILETIRFGHKFALKNIEKNKKVYKYGTPIGFASNEIKKGGHIHIHNLKTLQRSENENERL